MKIKILIILICLLTIKVYCSEININNIDENYNKNFYSYVVKYIFDYKIINLSDTYNIDEKGLLKNNDSIDIKKNDKTTKIENSIINDINNYGKFINKYTINKDLSIDLYAKAVNNAEENKCCCFIFVLNDKNNSQIIWKYWEYDKYHDMPFKVLDIIISNDFNRMVLLTQESDLSFSVYNINIKEHICYRNIIPPYNSMAVYSKKYLSAKLWTDNIVKFEFEKSTEYYKIYQTKEDVLKNYDLSDGSKIKIYISPRLIYSTDNNNRSYDYSDIEPKFNLNGFYYKESKDNLANEIFF